MAEATAEEPEASARNLELLPLRAESEQAAGFSCKGFVPACSNFSIQYNYSSASIASAIMLSHRDVTGDEVIPDFPQPPWAAHLLLGSVFVGSVVGMLTMGYLGDLIGTRHALILTNGLAALGAVFSALLSWGTSEAVWAIIAASRLIMGIGVGGNYPLSAAKAAEHNSGGAPSEASAASAAFRAAKAFFWQGPGSLSPYVLALPLLRLPHRQGITSLQFRVLLGVGALPAGVVLLASLFEGGAAVVRPGQEKLGQALKERRHWRVLIGTAGGWFLFDVAFYGTVIFSPTILLNVFGSTESLSDLSLHASVTILVLISGNLLSLAVLPYIGAKALNTLGFVLSALAFGAFALAYGTLHDHHLLLFVLP
eukprot:TRINITY_DN96722_c0_g1_i1.p1 TRINITY_DN96722_c0_g1~~TRINITY_DN96722_c0_g1_i1.p1  ORF type:complete len:368 (-),score=63.52 TRINITY_DN96722_c0_g1_i1:15-1118(-)